MRNYIIKIEGKEYRESGSFAYGRANAIKDCLEKNYPAFELVSSGVSYGHQNSKELFKAEAVNFDARMGLFIWVFEV